MTAAVHPMLGNGVRWPAALPVQSQAVVFRDDLQARAVKLWPDTEECFEHNRSAWIKAVQLARSSKRGWLADVKERSHG